MSWVAAATIGSAAIGAYGTSRAADAQDDAGDAAIAEQRNSRLRADENLRPYREAGYDALPELSSRTTPATSSFDDPYRRALSDPNQLNYNERELLSHLQDGSNPLSTLLNRSPDTASRDAYRDRVNSGSGFSDFVSKGYDDESLKLLQDVVRSGGGSSVEFDRREGFDDIAQYAAATGKRSDGGTFRDLAEFSHGLDARDEQRRIDNINDLVNTEQFVRRNRGDELLVDRQQGNREVLDLIGLDDSARSNRINELLLARQSRTGDLSTASDVSRRGRDDYIDRMREGVGYDLGLDDKEYNRLYDLVNFGASAAAGTAATHTRSGENIGDIMLQQGNVRGAANQGYGNIAQNTISDLIQMYQRGKMTPNFSEDPLPQLSDFGR